MSDNESGDILYALFGLGFGIWSFFFGFNRLRRKRLIENIPTSTIRGLAMGLVEIHGRAKANPPLKSPFTKTDCTLYKYTIEEYRSSGKHSRWVTINSGNSFSSPVILDDSTGRAEVFPSGAELFMPIDYTFCTNIFSDTPHTIIEFLENNNIQYKNWIGKRSLRFKEWYIKEDEEVYVLGTAKNPENSSLDAIIVKGDVEPVFIISDHSEKELTKKLATHCFLRIYGGAALSLASLAYLLYRFLIIGF